MRIICGYQGVGKTTYCKETDGAFDLESTNYVKNIGWAKRYVDDCLQKFKEGYTTVCMSAHQAVIYEILKRKLQKKFDLVVAVPAENKEAWGSRLRYRYHQCQKQYALNALNDFLKNYDNDMECYRKLKRRRDIRVVEVSAKVRTNLSEQVCRKED